MNWKEFDNNHNYQKKVILVASGIIISVLLVVILFISGTDAYFVIKNAPHLNDKLLRRDICYHAFDSIAKKNGNPLVIERQYLSNIEKIDYKFIDFKIKHDLYRIIKETGSDTCKIVIAAETKNTHSLRSFHLTLSSNDNYPFNYKVNGIGEVLLSEKDLEKERLK